MSLVGPDLECRWRCCGPRVSLVEVLLEGCRQGCLRGPDRGCVSLEGAVQRKVQII